MDTVAAFVVMGVCGSGKTTVGRELASALNIPFYDADDFHSPGNKKKMGKGIPLTDADRGPWLKTLGALITESLAKEMSLVLACSALKQAYRDILGGGDKRVVFVYLKGAKEIFHARMAERKKHYMKPGMLDSQFRDLEEPGKAMKVNAALPPVQAVAFIIGCLQNQTVESTD